VVTPGTSTCDFKGPFAPAKDGGETSMLGFKHPSSGYVHEECLTRQAVDAAIEVFDEFPDVLRVRFHVTIDSLLFDRDTAFNKRLRAALLKRDVCPDMSGAYGHYQLGSVEKYWDVWQSTVIVLLVHSCTAVSTKRTGNLLRK
jgi:hypothetical protein